MSILRSADMTLRRKMLLIVSATVVALTLALFALSRSVLLRGFARVEEREALHNLERAQRALSETLKSLEEHTSDYAAWTPTYEFVKTRDSDYPDEALPKAQYSRWRVDLIALCDKRNRLVYGKGLDFRTGEDVPLPSTVAAHLAQAGPPLLAPDAQHGHSGVLVLGRTPMLVASWPILKTDQKGPSRGTFVMGRYLDADEVRRLAHEARLELGVWVWDAPALPSDVRSAGELLTPTSPSLVQALDDESIAAYGLVPDLYDSPGLLLRVTMPRPIRAQAGRSMTLLLASVAGTGIVIGALTLLLLERTGLSRLKRLERSVTLIAAEQRFAGRVEDKGGDELSRLAGAVNSMLDSLEESHRSLRASEERYDLALRGANDGIWDWDLVANEVYFSPRWKSMLGHAELEIGRSPEEWLERVHPLDLEPLKARIAAVRAGSQGPWEHEYRARCKDGSQRWFLCRGSAVTDAAGQVVRIVGAQTDVHERKEMEQRLVHDALYDALTGLPNRTLLLDCLARALARGKRHRDRRCAVLFIDLDRFKLVNDSLGHLAGDRLLAAVAKRLRSCVRPEDTVARLGGDEFVILLEDVRDGQGAAQTAERVQRELHSPHRLEDRELVLTASIGIALSGGGRELPEELLRDADTAMYQAKAHGRSRHELFSDDMQPPP